MLLLLSFFRFSLRQMGKGMGGILQEVFDCNG